MTVTGENPGQVPGTPENPTGLENPTTTPTQETSPTPTPTTPPATQTLPDTLPDMDNDDAWSALPKWVRDLRAENASRRVENKTLAEQVEEFQRSQMSELELLKADVTKFRDDVIPSKDREIRQLQVQVAAASAGAVDTDAVVQLLDWSKVDAGTSINDAISELLEAKPYLKATTPPAPTPPPTPTSPPSTTRTAAPGNGENNGNTVFTKEQLQSMTLAEYEKNRDKIHEAMRNNRL